MDVNKAKGAAQSQANNPLGAAFGPGLIAKIAQDPNLRHKLSDQQFMMKLKMLQSNPQMMMQSSLQDPDMQAVMSLALGINLAGPGGGFGDEPDAPPPAPAPAPPPAPEPEPEVERTPEEQAAFVGRAERYLREDSAETGRGAGATWIFRGGGSRRRRLRYSAETGRGDAGYDVDIPRRRVAATPATTWRCRGDGSRRRRGYETWSDAAATT